MEGISYLLMLPVVSNLVLGSIVLRRDPRDKTFQLFFTLCLLVTLWGIATLVYIDYQSLLGARLAFALGIWILTIAVFFARNYPTKQGLAPGWRAAVLGTSTLLSVLSLSGAVLASFPRVAFGFLLPLYVTYFFILFAATLYTFITQFRQSVGYERQVLLFVLLSCCLSILWGTVFDLVVPIIRGDITYNRLGVLTAPFLTLGIAYTIIRHRLFNLQLQTQRLINVVVPVGMTAALTVAGGFLLNRSALLFNPLIGGTLIIGAIGLYESLRHLFIKTRVGYVLFRPTYRFHEGLLRLGATVARYSDLNKLADAVKQAFTAERYFSGFGFFIVTEQAERTWIPHEVTALDFERLSMFRDANLHRELFDYLRATGVPLVVDELPYRRLALSPELQNALTELAGGVCVPLLVGRDLAGVLVLGARANRGAYTDEDIAVLEKVSVPLAVAVTKALLLADYQRRTDQLTRDKNNLEASIVELKRMKSTFLDIVDHQFNTFLSIIKSGIAMLRDGDVAISETKEFLDSLWPRIEEFDQINQGMLRAAHLNGDRAELRFAPLDVNAMVRSIVNDSAALAATRQVKIDLKLADALPRVLTDPDYFLTAVRELVKNALIYGQGGTVRVQTQTADGQVMLSIEDTGRGFDTDEAEHIGEKFYRGPHIADYLANGSGLGVFVAKRVAEASGGTLTWHSNGPGKGSIFTIVLRTGPFVMAEHAAPANAAAWEPSFPLTTASA